MKSCPGYAHLLDACFVSIPDDRELCFYCTRTRERETAPQLLEVGGATCPCGGDADGYRHDASLLHMTWVNRQRAERGLHG